MLTVPPFRLDGVALKVTGVPAHIAPEGEAAIVTVGVTPELTVVTIVFERAVFVVRQFPPATLITQTTWLAFVSEFVVYVFDAPDWRLVPFTLKS